MFMRMPGLYTRMDRAFLQTKGEGFSSTQVMGIAAGKKCWDDSFRLPGISLCFLVTLSFLFDGAAWH